MPPKAKSNGRLPEGTEKPQTIQELRQANEQAAMTEINEILKQHNCRLEAKMVISKEGVFPQIAVQSNE